MSKSKVAWPKGRFWPGYKWRVLAHNRYNRGTTTDASYPQHHEIHLSSEDYPNPIEFDELVIDHWFHLEQMADRDWWIGLGNWHINVHIDGDGFPHISSYENETEEEMAEYIERIRTNNFPALPATISPAPRPVLVQTKRKLND